MVYQETGAARRPLTLRRNGIMILALEPERWKSRKPTTRDACCEGVLLALKLLLPSDARRTI